MKNKIAAIIIASSIIGAMPCINALAYGNIEESAAGFHEQTKNFAVTGGCTYENNDITFMMINENAEDINDRIGYVQQLKTDDLGNYTIKFKFDKNYQDYKAVVRAGDEDITHTIQTASVSGAPLSIELELTDDEGYGLHIGEDSVAKAIASVKNLYGDDTDYKMIVAQYDKDGVLCGATSFNKSVKFNKTELVETSTPIAISTKADMVKLFAWESETMIPLADFVKADTSGSTALANLNDKNGEGNLNIVFIGGSITQSAYSDLSKGEKRYVNIVGDWFKEQYPNKNVQYYNAGISATGSNFGEIRACRDICSKNPDVVFVEYAVNDYGDACRGHMESIVRNLQKLPKKPVIIFLYSARYEQAFNDPKYPEGTWVNPYEGAKHQEVADYYGIGSVNEYEYIYDRIVNKKDLTWSEYATDVVHPSQKPNGGQQIYGEYIIDCLENNWDDYIKIPENKPAYFGGEYNNLKLVNYYDSRIKYEGNVDFSNMLDSYKGSKLDLGTGLYEEAKDTVYKYPYYHYPEQGRYTANMPIGSKVTFKFTGKRIGVVYCRQRFPGFKLKYTIDGKIKGETTWENPNNLAMTSHIFLDFANNLSEGEHTITIEVVEGSYDYSGVDAYQSQSEEQKEADKHFIFGYFITDEER